MINPLRSLKLWILKTQLAFEKIRINDEDAVKTVFDRIKTQYWGRGRSNRSIRATARGGRRMLHSNCVKSRQQRNIRHKNKMLTGPIKIC
jgi:hypothetical protein